MKIGIKKSLSYGIDLFTGNQLLLQIKEEGIYRHCVYEGPLRESFSLDFSYQIEEEEKSP